jgi:hypothetical protein
LSAQRLSTTTLRYFVLAPSDSMRLSSLANRRWLTVKRPFASDDRDPLWPDRVEIDSCNFANPSMPQSNA